MPKNPDPEGLRARNRKGKKPPAERLQTRQGRVLSKIARAMDDPNYYAGVLTDRQRAWYRGTVTGLVDGLKRGAFRRRWPADRDLIRRVQRACARWIDGVEDALPEDFEDC